MKKNSSGDPWYLFSKLKAYFLKKKIKTNEGIWSLFSSYASSIRLLNLFLAAASGQKTNGGNRDFPNGKISSRNEKGGGEEDSAGDLLHKQSQNNV